MSLRRTGTGRGVAFCPMPRLLLPLLVLPLLMAPAAFAQSSAEFGRYSAGQLDLVPKASNHMSGSLGLTFSGFGRGEGATFGGALVRDRVFFFASADRDEFRLPTVAAAAPQFSSSVFANLGDRNTLGASFSDQRASSPLTIPSSFLSLHYTGIVSPNMFVTASVSQKR